VFCKSYMEEWGGGGSGLFCGSLGDRALPLDRLVIGVSGIELALGGSLTILLAAGANSLPTSRLFL